MSEITESKTSTKKIGTILEEIKGLNAESLPKLKEYVPKLEKLVESFEEEYNNNTKTLKANSDEISLLKNRISQNKRDISSLEEQNVDLTKKGQELGVKIQENSNEKNETLKIISTKKGETENRERRLQELEKEVQELEKNQSEFDEKMKGIDNQNQAEFEKKDKFVKSFENRVNAMKLLIEKEYIRSSQVLLIQSLQRDTPLELKNIILALDMKMQTAKDILRKIAELGGPIEYDDVAAKVTLKAEVDFKK